MRKSFPLVGRHRDLLRIKPVDKLGGGGRMSFPILAGGGGGRMRVPILAGGGGAYESPYFGQIYNIPYRPPFSLCLSGD